jgi:hypothetical protein
MEEGKGEHAREGHHYLEPRILPGYPLFFFLRYIIEIGEPAELYGKGGGFIRYPRVHFAPKKKES